MKPCVLLLLVFLGSSWGAPVEQEGPEQASCTDPVVLGAARQAMDKINKDRKEGYVYSLRDLANAHIQKHGENSDVFYLTMNVLETNCSVLSKAEYKDCEVRDIVHTPVYGQCKVAIFISRVHRVVRLYKYNCVVRPVSAEKVHRICPDCSTHIDKDNEEIQKTVSKTLEKFNSESELAHHFSLLQVTRATSAIGEGVVYAAEYTIQETNCSTGADRADCSPLDCEFAHRGLCKGSLVYAPTPTKEEFLTVKCEIYESEASEREKKLHLLGGETDHSHNDTHVQEQGHDHVHDHTKGHGHHDDTHKHTDSDQHHHSHDHGGHRHAHDHSHDHGHGHDHVHAHHDKAHDHTKDHPNQHHKYQHAADVSTHQHDHEMALDHDHKHAHLHEHEHHHHHHGHVHESTPHDHPEGMWRQIPPLGAPVTLPAFPDVPAAGPEVGVTLPLKPDPQIPEQVEPTIGPFPTKVSAQCPPPLLAATIVDQLFLEDPEFKVVV
ncbi:LOW QUALITY PROTEIN: fetuin-B-like [Boleophthalmus pectinirostris]|uniref:LOW QUALITY PROTEIN: fetuin-B-like n=1 Tax=Boleophthalmus pectinirostris TaxID=150288 RepID=UPI00242D1923|nr:LOW QUALITY PROTEIN: fetuin-B-like [Boleophthalmus pectinirostris]